MRRMRNGRLRLEGIQGFPEAPPPRMHGCCHPRADVCDSKPEHMCELRGIGTSRRPVALQCGEHFRRPEPDGPAQFEGWDHPGNPPLAELAAADLEEGGHFGLGEELKFVARRGWVRVHAGATASTRRPRMVTSGDNLRGDSSSHCGVVAVNSPPQPAVTTVTNHVPKIATPEPEPSGLASATRFYRSVSRAFWRRSFAGMRVSLPSFTTMRSVPVSIAVLRAASAARFIAANEARRSGSLASAMSLMVVGALPIPAEPGFRLRYHTWPTHPPRTCTTVPGSAARR